MEDRGWKIEDGDPQSSILDLQFSIPSLQYSSLHYGPVVPATQQILNSLKRFAALRHGLSNRIDGANEIFAFGLVQRFEQFEILKVKPIVNDDRIVQRLLGKVAESVRRMPGDPLRPFLFSPSEDSLPKTKFV